VYRTAQKSFTAPGGGWVMHLCIAPTLVQSLTEFCYVATASTDSGSVCLY